MWKQHIKVSILLNDSSHVYGFTGCMIGQHATVSISDAYQKGLSNFDVETAYKGVYSIK